MVDWRSVRSRRGDWGTVGLVAAALVGAALAGVAAPVAADPPGLPPGHRFEVRVADLPLPGASPSVRNPPRVIALPEGATLTVPPGFEAGIFAEGLDHARWLAVAPDGAVLLAQSQPGVVTILRDSDGDGRADSVAPYVTGLTLPHGLAFNDGHLYVADQDFVRRYPYRPGADQPAGPAERITAPGAFGAAGGHWTRSLAFSPDRRRFFVAVGSRDNLAIEAAPRATVQMFDADGSGQRTFASGLRNAVGMAFQPGTSDLYVVVNERDGMGDELVPDFLTRIRARSFFGWPFAYSGPNPQPELASRRPDLVRKSQVPDVLFQSHSTPLGLVFYDAEQFPAVYRGDGFVALHGSFNAASPRGYMVVRVPFRDGRPRGDYEAFATGFWTSGADRPVVFGRPAGLVIAADGSLLIADDVGQRIWRVSYGG